MTGWAAAHMPSQQGRTALVTGANSGIGFHAALELARRGAVVLLACRDAGRARDARAAIERQVPAAAVEPVALDLADLDSVARLADQVASRDDGLDLLINNAGVMAVPVRRTTAQGFELQFGTNHLGHFALTVRLLPALLARPGSRVVTVCSQAHRFGSIRFEDLNSERGYGPWRAYSQSKLANALFTLELDRRLRTAGAPASSAPASSAPASSAPASSAPASSAPASSAPTISAPTISVGAHPGYSHTPLLTSGPRLGGGGLAAQVMGLAGPITGQPAAQGALPVLRAATDPQTRGGDYYGPGGLGQMRGSPRQVGYARTARDERLAGRLWQACEALTGVSFPAGPRA